MKIVLICVAGLVALILVVWARRRESSVASEEIVVGGLYAEKDEKGTFGVSKVLAVDDTTVHVRIYRNKFSTLPQNLDPTVLSLGRIGDPAGFGVGHAPVAREGWLSSKVFLQKEPVREDELKGYRYYLQEMGR